jgi:hypothetical protein
MSGAELGVALLTFAPARMREFVELGRVAEGQGFAACYTTRRHRRDHDVHGGGDQRRANCAMSEKTVVHIPPRSTAPATGSLPAQLLSE